MTKQETLQTLEARRDAGFFFIRCTMDIQHDKFNDEQLLQMIDLKITLNESDSVELDKKILRRLVHMARTKRENRRRFF